MYNSPYVGRLAWRPLVSSQSPENRQTAPASQHIPFPQSLEYTHVPISCSPASLMALANSFSRKLQPCFRAHSGQMVRVLSSHEWQYHQQNFALLCLNALQQGTQEHKGKETSSESQGLSPREGTNTDTPHMFCAPKSPLLTNKTLQKLMEPSPVNFT